MPAIIEACPAVVKRVPIKLRNMNPKMPVIPPITSDSVVLDVNSDLSEDPRFLSSIKNKREAIEYLKKPIVKGWAMEVKILIATQLAPQTSIDIKSAA